MSSRWMGRPWLSTGRIASRELKLPDLTRVLLPVGMVWDRMVDECRPTDLSLTEVPALRPSEVL